MIRAYDESVRALSKADGTDMKNILSLAVQRAFVCSLGTEQASDVPERIDDEEEKWDFEATVTVEEADTADIRGKLRKLQRVCGDGGQAVLTTIARVIDLTRGGVGGKCGTATWSKQNAGIKTEFKEAHAIKATVREQVAGETRQTPALKAHLDKAQLPFEKPTGEMSRTEAAFWAHVVTVEGALNAKNVRVERLECDVVVEAEKRQQLPTERRETSETANRQLAEDGELLRKSQSVIATVMVELKNGVS